MITNKKHRFGGIERLYGITETTFLQQAHVCVVGIGGVGSWAAEALARSGIGHITLIDMDDICVTNINRQIHADSHTIGRLKTEVMQQRLLSINPECQVYIIDDFISADNINNYFSPKTEHTLQTPRFDYVIDAIDAVSTKSALLAYCKRNKQKIIMIGGAGGQIDPTKIMVADLSKTIQDPLASKVRHQLRQQYNFSNNPKRKFGIDCVFSTEHLRYPDLNGSVCVSKQLLKTRIKQSCDTGFGASTMVTATFGFIAVAKVIDKIIQHHLN